MARRDTIEAPLEDEPVPDWHLEIIRERLAEHRAHPEAVISLEEFRDELRKLHKLKPDSEL